MHPENSFITLTYDNEHLLSPKLQYKDFQDFMKRLRSKYAHYEISYFVTGEYGDKTKRPHWHAIIFGWQPADATHKYTNERGDRVFSSQILTDLWGNGIAEFGSVTFDSAGYCARYAAKKLAHGHDDHHDWHPISKKSSKHAIGKKWLEVYYQDIFDHGKIHLSNGTITASVPRYYEKWLAKNKPGEWRTYVTNAKLQKAEHAIENAEEELNKEIIINDQRRIKQGLNYNPQITKIETRQKIQQKVFDELQKHLKL